MWISIILLKKAWGGDLGFIPLLPDHTFSHQSRDGERSPKRALIKAPLPMSCAPTPGNRFPIWMTRFDGLYEVHGVEMYTRSFKKGGEDTVMRLFVSNSSNYYEHFKEKTPWLKYQHIGARYTHLQFMQSFGNQQSRNMKNFERNFRNPIGMYLVVISLSQKHTAEICKVTVYGKRHEIPHWYKQSPKDTNRFEKDAKTAYDVEIGRVAPNVDWLPNEFCARPYYEFPVKPCIDITPSQGQATQTDVKPNENPEDFAAGLALDPDPLRCSLTRWDKNPWWRVEFPEEIRLEVIYIGLPDMPAHLFGSINIMKFFVSSKAENKHNNKIEKLCGQLKFDTLDSSLTCVTKRLACWPKRVGTFLTVRVVSDVDSNETRLKICSIKTIGAYTKAAKKSFLSTLGNIQMVQRVASSGLIDGQQPGTALLSRGLFAALEPYISDRKGICTHKLGQKVIDPLSTKFGRED
ncbi:hypothetical protein CAPTEDRAFT_207084 [Capitella teleta]|uniref:Fucolectin tachylectin-4 pentraxin-1 domain-containing protein n=1 Tax=Capitella teleta TaxID=283909 RepID=R7VEY3_CAPTE|nr:hypothetical protein CAPTEDRAFT_207084 [Capitella teleta]|eukprot:ELU17418.1 hypothetical protein CAPTEDRAFT_207084 [Capitella teleta]